MEVNRWKFNFYHVLTFVPDKQSRNQNKYFSYSLHHLTTQFSSVSNFIPKTVCYVSIQLSRNMFLRRSSGFLLRNSNYLREYCGPVSFIPLKLSNRFIFVAPTVSYFRNWCIWCRIDEMKKYLRANKSGSCCGMTLEFKISHFQVQNPPKLLWKNSGFEKCFLFDFRHCFEFQLFYLLWNFPLTIFISQSIIIVSIALGCLQFISLIIYSVDWISVKHGIRKSRKSTISLRFQGQRHIRQWRIAGQIQRKSAGYREYRFTMRTHQHQLQTTHRIARQIQR